MIREVSAGDGGVEARPLALQRKEARGTAAGAVAKLAATGPVIGPGYGSPIPTVALLRAGMVGDGEAPRPVSLRRREAGPEPERGDASQIAATGVAGPGQALPHVEAIQQSFGNHDVSGVRAHVGGSAAQAADALGAEAFATGNDVAFHGSPDLHTAAHEAAHVVQQRGGVQLKGGVGRAGDLYEQHADAVADQVVRGESAEPLLDAFGGGKTGAGGPDAVGPLGVQRKPGATGPQSGAGPADPTSHSDPLMGFLNTPDPVAGVGDFSGAFGYLNGLSMGDMLQAIGGAANQGLLPLLMEHSSAAADYDRPRLMSALYAVHLAQMPASSVNQSELRAAGAELDQIPEDQQLEVFEYILNQKGASMSATTLMEGVVAMREGEAAGDTAPAGGNSGGAPMAAATTGAPPSVEPGPWAPPGEQPIPFYIGNEAHRGIARNYVAAHAGDRVASNTVSLATSFRIFRELGQTPNAGALNSDELGLMPDIANLSRLHLYEIKPLAAQGLGAAKATIYLGLFARAGVAMTLGPTNEPGTEGGIPAPGGVYVFWSPEPGVIVYQYRHGRLVPVPVPVPEGAKERRWKLELEPLTPQQQPAIATVTLGTAMLIMMMIMLAPVGI